MYSQITICKVCKNGFKTTWEIDEKMFDDRQPFNTESKTVEGMPDVKWYLECDNDDEIPDFFIYVESEYEIKYSLEYKVRASDPTQTQQEHSTRINKVQLSRIEKSNFANYVKNGKVTFELQANFSYKNKSINNFNVCEAANWGLRLKENNAADLDIVVDEKIIQICKVCINGFKTFWEIDPKMFDGQKPFKTESKTVDLMPDVKWYLECDNHAIIPDFFIYVESQYEIKYSLEYKVRASDPTQTQQEQSVGIKKVTLSRIQKLNLAHYVKKGKVTFELHANFSYKNKSDYYNVRDSAEWGLRLKENNAADFDILVDEKTIKIHKFMFIPESPVFARLFESNFMEAKENKVLITDFKHEIVQAAVDYCYRQDISDFLKEDKNMTELLRFADKYDFQTLKPKVEAEIISSISKENVFLFASIADKINAEQLRQACINFFQPLLKILSPWPNAEMSEEVDPKFFKDLVLSALNINNGD